MRDSPQTLIVINAVLADRVDDFEEWLRSVATPAIRDQRPDLDGRWRVLRATEADDDAVIFAFVCEGGVPEDWDLLPVLEHALGRAAAELALERFGGMLRGGEQQSWFLEPVALDRP